MILRGQYIQLEPMNETHSEILKEISQDEKISAYSPALKLKFDSWFDKALKTSHQSSFIIRSLSDDKIVGSTRYYDIHTEHQRLAIGYTWIIQSMWGTFVNPESKLLLLKHAFDVLSFNRVEFFIDSRNSRSLAAIKKIGATEEGLLRQHIVLDDGYIRDTVVCSILKSEWPLVQRNLEEKLSLGQRK